MSDPLSGTLRNVRLALAESGYELVRFVLGVE